QLEIAVQLDQAIDDASRVRPAINIVAKSDDQIFPAGLGGGQKRIEHREVAMDIADGEDASGHAQCPFRKTPALMTPTSATLFSWHLLPLLATAASVSRETMASVPVLAAA